MNKLEPSQLGLAFGDSTIFHLVEMKERKRLQTIPELESAEVKR
jgi:hypothetical protein